MFLLDAAFSTELLALIAGTALLLWVAKSDVPHKAFAKVVAYFTIVASVLAMFCTLYYGLYYRQQGYFDKPYMMMDCPMMNKSSEMR